MTLQKNVMQKTIHLWFSSTFFIPVNYRKLYLFPKGICSDLGNPTAHMQMNYQLLEINDFSCCMCALGMRALPKLQCRQFWMQSCLTYWLHEGNQTQKQPSTTRCRFVCIMKCLEQVTEIMLNIPLHGCAIINSTIFLLVDVPHFCYYKQCICPYTFSLTF